MKEGKTISSRQLAQLKRNFQNVSPLIVKRSKLIEQIKKLKDEYDGLNAAIEGTEAGSRFITGGVNAVDLLIRETVTTDKTDASGRPIVQTKYVPNPERLRTNENGTYTIMLEEEPQPVNDPEGIMSDPGPEGQQNNNWFQN